MFFFIAGIQPRTINVDSQRRLCHSCGCNEMRLKRIDHYFAFFFLPLFPVKKGLPFLVCERCGNVLEKPVRPWRGETRVSHRVCLHCGRPLEMIYRFCPYCGKPI